MPHQFKLPLSQKSKRETVKVWTVWIDWDKPITGLAYTMRPESGDLPVPTKDGEFYSVGTARSLPLTFEKWRAEELAKLIPNAYVDRV
jgi:hypothetical protein